MNDGRTCGVRRPSDARTERSLRANVLLIEEMLMLMLTRRETWTRSVKTRIAM